MSALDKFKDWNLTFNKPGIDQVHLPDDITAIDSENLGKLFTELTAWTDYIESQTAMAILEERAALKAKDYQENLMMIKRMGTTVKGERITIIKAEIATHPDIVALDNTYEEKYAYRKLVEMLLTNHERDLSLVSREITRRTNDYRRNI
jgi:hypothetical protein